jgi:Rrf2 family protein
MGNILAISSAANLAFHAMTYLVFKRDQRVSVKEMAEYMNGSEAHLFKVMRRLVRAGLVRSMRGPGGGFSLAKPPERIFLLEIYEAIEGSLEELNCLFPERICRGDRCILGDLLPRVSREIRSYLAKTRLSELTNVYERRTG